MSEFKFKKTMQEVLGRFPDAEKGIMVLFDDDEGMQIGMACTGYELSAAVMRLMAYALQLDSGESQREWRQ